MQQPNKKPKRKSKADTLSPSLSACNTSLEEGRSLSLDEVRDKVFASLNNAELEKALGIWLKDNQLENKITARDLGILKNIITEYMDAYLLFGYNSSGDRIILQHFKNAKDRDAIMEFLKAIFLKQQHENFLDADDDE